MPNIQYIVVADSSNARIYRSDEHLSELALVNQQDNPGGSMKGIELDADGPGMNRGARSFTHSYGGNEDPQQQEREEFARSLSKYLQSEHLAGRFSSLILVAPPHFLGELRQNLSEGCMKVVSKTVNKNLLQETDAAIISHLA